MFDDVHAAMMVHPWPTDWLQGTCLAVSHFDVTLHGQEAHASAAPWEGVNAGDAMAVAQVALGLLRQQFRPGDQVHGDRHRRRTGGQHHPRVGPRSVHVPVDVAGGSRGPRAPGHGVLRGRRPGHRDRSSGATWLRPTPTWRATRTCSTSTGSTPRRSAGRSRSTTSRPRPTLSTDMANVSLAVPDHPPAGRHRRRRLGQPPARVRRGLRDPVGRRGSARRRPGHGLDGHRRRSRSDAGCAPAACWPAERPPERPAAA